MRTAEEWAEAYRATLSSTLAAMFQAAMDQAQTETKMLTYVRVVTDFEALHRWPGAPDVESYLREPHRHLFTVDVRLEVKHGDRELEINRMRRWLDSYLAGWIDPPDTGLPTIGSHSCEMIAKVVVDALWRRYGVERAVRVEVLEDGLLGGGVAAGGL